MSLPNAVLAPLSALTSLCVTPRFRVRSWVLPADLCAHGGVRVCSDASGNLDLASMPHLDANAALERMYAKGARAAVHLSGATK